MRIPRIYHPETLHPSQLVRLSDEAAHHVARVLRMTTGDKLELFDGSGCQFVAVINEINKKHVIAQLEQGLFVSRESPLNLHLGQVISRGEKMEFTIQKSIELGVNVITPLLSERCGVKLDGERLDKKVQQWQKIAIAACEQCGRNQIPLIRPVMHLQPWCAEQELGLKLNLHPQADKSINSLSTSAKQIRLLIGPEGGLSDAEINMTTDYAFTDILLGPRILRTETAALTAITALQVRFGDLS